MAVITRNGNKPTEGIENTPGLNLGLAALGSLGSPLDANANALALSPLDQSLSLDGAPSDIWQMSFAQLLRGTTLPPRQHRQLKKAQEQNFSIRLQGQKLNAILQGSTAINQQVAISTAQFFALLTTLKHLSSDPDYQAWWTTWSKFMAERAANTTDELLVVQARILADVLAQPIQSTGNSEKVSLWDVLFDTDR